MSIPLVQEATKDAINTSIIAIKRNIERINMLLGLSNSEEIDTSEFVKKSDIVDVVEAGNMNPVTSNAVVPVDEVTLGNMQSVTSNAVAVYANKQIKYKDQYFTNLTLTNNGYVSIEYGRPSGMNNFLFALIWDYGSTTSKDAIAVNASGTYIGGTANSVINYVTIRYFYTD